MANAYTAGDSLPLKFTAVDAAGNLVVATTVTLNVTKPDGTIDGPFTVTSTTGNYTYSYTTSTTTYGRYVATWIATGTYPSSAAEAFNVLPATPIVTLAEMKRHLGQTASTADDDEIAAFLIAAIPIIESIAGPITPTTITQTFDGGHPQVRLHHPPVTVTSVTEFGRTLIAGVDYVVDFDYGVVRRGTTYFSYTFFYGSQNVTVTYVAGPTVVPSNVQFAVKELVKYLWRQIHGGPASFQDGFVPAASTAGVSDAMMKRLRLLLGKSVAGPSVM